MLNFANLYVAIFGVISAIVALQVLRQKVCMNLFYFLQLAS